MKTNSNKSLVWVLCVASLSLSSAGPGVPTAAGAVVNTRCASQALEGNFRGTHPTRYARVYLPPDYATSDRRYAVLYYLHGAWADEDAFFNASGDRNANGMISRGEMEPMIIVGVDASGGLAGLSCYENSELNGNYEDYIVQDLVNHVDATFRTIAHRDSRGVFGASAGGSAALRYAMTHPDVFGAAYSISTGFFAPMQPEGFFNYSGDVAVFAYYPNAGADLARVRSEQDVFQSTARRVVFGTTALYSVNTNDPPLYVDLPFELPSLQIIPAVRAKFEAADEFVMLERYWENLLTVRALGFDMGNLETYGLTFSNRFHQRLVELGVPHQYEIFDGDHSNRRAERIVEAMKFLSASLITEELPIFVSAPRRTPDGIALEWKEAASGVTLQKALSLVHPEWQDIPISEGQTNVVVGTEDGEAYFRLMNPNSPTP